MAAAAASCPVLCAMAHSTLLTQSVLPLSFLLSSSMSAYAHSPPAKLYKNAEPCPVMTQPSVTRVKNSPKAQPGPSVSMVKSVKILESPGLMPGMAVSGGSWLSSTNMTSAAAVRAAVSVSFFSLMTALPFR